MTATLWRNKDYLLFWWSRASSILGSQVSYIALPLFAKHALRNPAEVALVTVCSYGSGLLFALHAGVVGDRFNRKHVMVATDVLRAALVGLLVWQAAVGGAALWSLCLIALAVGALSVIFDSASAAALPDLVGEDLFARAMSRNQSRDFVLAMIGPLLGAVLFTAGPAWAFAADAGSYLVSALLLALISTKLTVAPQPARTLAMIRGGLRTVLADRLLGRLTLYVSVLNLVLTAGVLATIVHFPAGSIGIALAAQSVGGLLGSLVAERLHRRLPVGAILGLHGGLWFAGLTAVGLAPTTPVVAIGLGLGWLVAPALRLALGSRLVAVVQPELRARANSAISLSTSSFSLLGPPIAGFAVGSIGYGGTMAGLGVIAALAVLLVRGRLRRPP
ncbi:MFS transporter [Kutzneria chonburiensis]|uniref:MFS transporter n=1 Tax=Kutzneria chonburiensis TaxID=1483604 RepID=A0ABV6MNT1_9PSEU|nr:MFS transporter [Kutzneria chonburiensis]